MLNNLVTPGVLHAPPCLASGGGLRLARPLRASSASPEPWVCALPLPTSEEGLRLAQPQGRGLRLARRRPIPPPTTPGQSSDAREETGTPRCNPRPTTGHTWGFISGIASGVPVLFCLTPVRTLMGTSVHHDVRQDGVERHDRQIAKRTTRPTRLAFACSLQ